MCRARYRFSPALESAPQLIVDHAEGDIPVAYAAIDRAEAIMDIIAIALAGDIDGESGEGKERGEHHHCPAHMAEKESYSRHSNQIK